MDFNEHGAKPAETGGDKVTLCELLAQADSWLSGVKKRYAAALAGIKDLKDAHNPQHGAGLTMACDAMTTAIEDAQAYAEEMVRALHATATPVLEGEQAGPAAEQVGPAAEQAGPAPGVQDEAATPETAAPEAAGEQAASEGEEGNG
jgi:2-hydroxychromene-2-carboxylate isomerase